MNKLRCAKAERLIVSALDEGLDRASQGELDRHLSECPACREFLTDTAEVLSTVRRSPVEDPGEVFWRHYQVSLDAQLRSREPFSRAFRTWSNAAFAAGFALIMLAVGLGVLEIQHDAPTVSYGQLAAIGDIDRLFGIGSDDWFLQEPRLPGLLAGFDAAHSSEDVSFSPLTDPAQDSIFGLEAESGFLR